MSLLSETYRKIDPEGEINHGFQDEEKKDLKFEENFIKFEQNLSDKNSEFLNA